MAKIQLVNVHSNNYFDKDYKTISIFKDNDLKVKFLDTIFANANSYDIYSNENTNDGIMIVLEGNFRNYTYAKLLTKYYFVTRVKSIFEKGLEKTQIYLEYDLINNSNLNFQDLKRNSSNNNFFLFRTNLPDIQPSYQNLLHCSNVCQNIKNDIYKKTRGLYQLTNVPSALNPSPNVHENIGTPIIYMRLKGS
jgi:hypothetical protein